MKLNLCGIILNSILVPGIGSDLLIANVGTEAELVFQWELRCFCLDLLRSCQFGSSAPSVLSCSLLELCCTLRPGWQLWGGLCANLKCSGWLVYFRKQNLPFLDGNQSFCGSAGINNQPRVERCKSLVQRQPKATFVLFCLVFETGFHSFMLASKLLR